MTDTTTEVREEAAPVVDLAPIQTRLDQMEARMIDRTPSRRTHPRRAGGVRGATARRRAAPADPRPRRCAVLRQRRDSSRRRGPARCCGYLDSTRYLFPRTGTVGVPRHRAQHHDPEGSPRTPSWLRVALRRPTSPAGHSPPPATPYTAVWYAGGDDIALELIEQSSPERRRRSSCRTCSSSTPLVTDKAFTLAAGDRGAAPWARCWTSPATRRSSPQLVTVSEQIRAITGQPGDRLSLTPASWGKLVSLTDADGRRILSSSSGGTDSDGSVNLVTPAVDVGGIQAFFNANARRGHAVQRDARCGRPRSRRCRCSPPTSPRWARTSASSGRSSPCPLYPTAIKVYSLTLAGRPPVRAGQEVTGDGGCGCGQ